MKSGFYDFVLLFQCVYLGFVLLLLLFCLFFLFPFFCRKHKKSKLTQVPYVIDLSLGEFLLKAHKEASGLAFMT